MQAVHPWAGHLSQILGGLLALLIAHIEAHQRDGWPAMRQRRKSPLSRFMRELQKGASIWTEFSGDRKVIAIEAKEAVDAQQPHGRAAGLSRPIEAGQRPYKRRDKRRRGVCDRGGRA